jgi:hypothetical protein
MPEIFNAQHTRDGTNTKTCEQELPGTEGKLPARRATDSIPTRQAGNRRQHGRQSGTGRRGIAPALPGSRCAQCVYPVFLFSQPGQDFVALVQQPPVYLFIRK